MAAVVPAPPLMVPQLTVGGAEESAMLRAACLSVATRLGAGTDQWIVLGSDPAGRRTLERPGRGTFLGFGVDVPVALAPGPVGEVRADLPLPLLIAGWLRQRAAPHVTARAELVPPELAPVDCARLGAELVAAAGPRTGLLVVGDGATTHTEKAPGYLDARAGPFDAAVADALADADPAGLLALDAELAAELNAVGRAPWQVLAGYALAHPALADGRRWRGEMAYSQAPYGVGYHVALWRLDR